MDTWTHRDCEIMAKTCTSSMQIKYQYVERQVGTKVHPYTRCYLQLITAGTGKISFPQWHCMGIWTKLQVQSNVQYKSYSIVLGLYGGMLANCTVFCLVWDFLFLSKRERSWSWKGREVYWRYLEGNWGEERIYWTHIIWNNQKVNRK